MSLAVKTWKLCNFFSEEDYYEKIHTILRYLNAGKDEGAIRKYLKIEGEKSFDDQKTLSDLMEKLFVGALGFVEKAEGSYQLTQEGRNIIENHKKGEVGYNKQLVFLYLARNSGGLFNIFYSLRSGNFTSLDDITRMVNTEREKEGFSPRRLWAFTTWGVGRQTIQRMAFRSL